MKRNPEDMEHRKLQLDIEELVNQLHLNNNKLQYLDLKTAKKIKKELIDILDALHTAFENRIYI